MTKDQFTMTKEEPKTNVRTERCRVERMSATGAAESAGIRPSWALGLGPWTFCLAAI